MIKFLFSSCNKKINNSKFFIPNLLKISIKLFLMIIHYMQSLTLIKILKTNWLSSITKVMGSESSLKEITIKWNSIIKSDNSNYLRNFTHTMSIQFFLFLYLNSWILFKLNILLLSNTTLLNYSDNMSKHILKYMIS